MSDEFVRRLRERADASVPSIPVETALVVPRARRRRAAMRSVSALAVVAVIGGSVWTAGAFRPGRTTNGPAGVETPSPVPADQRAGLFGVWKVTADGEGANTYLKLGGSQQADVWRDCGFVSGSWAVGPTRFVGKVSGWSTSCPESLPWLENAAYYRADGDCWQLLDLSGAVVATLWHDGVPTSRPGVSSDLARPPVVDGAMRAWVSDPAPLPAEVIPVSADLIAGRWRAAGASVANDPYVEFLADGGWNGSDGCNETGGRWAADLDGRLVVVGGASTLMGCGGAPPLSSLLVSARRAAFSGSGDLLLFDNEGMRVAQLTRVDGTGVSPVPGETLQATPGPGTATQPIFSCSAEGASAGGPIIATSAGVRVLAQNDGAPAGTYLNVTWDGGGTGRELPATPTEWVLPIPPGPFHLSCSIDDRTWGDLEMTVYDQNGYWRPETIQGKGCAGNALADWAVGPDQGKGATAQAAVDGLLPVFALDGPVVTGQIPVGYPDDPTETWMVVHAGKPFIALKVVDQGGSFHAFPDVLCAGS